MARRVIPALMLALCAVVLTCTIMAHESVYWVALGGFNVGVWLCNVINVS